MSSKTENRNGSRQKVKFPPERQTGATKPTEEKSPPDRCELAPLIDQGRAIAEAKKLLAQATGVKDPELAARIIDQVSHIQALWPFGNATEAVQAAAEMMIELKPENLMEALLATQSIGVHHAALSCLMRTGLPVKSVEDVDVYARVAARLMRLSIEQVEVMAKFRGKTSRQKVTVEQVHVHEGGQAIVGAVSTSPKPDSGREEPQKRRVRSGPSVPTNPVTVSN